MNRKIIVLDTNTLMSGLIFENSIPRKAVNKALLECEVVYSSNIMQELERVIQYPKFDKYINQAQKDEFLAEFKRLTICIENIDIQVVACRDPKDDKFLTLAVAANAGYSRNDPGQQWRLRKITERGILCP